MVRPPPLSCLQAFQAKESGEISWEEYIHHLLARCTGIKHEDDLHRTHWRLHRIDPFGYGIYCWSDRLSQIQPLTDIRPLEAVFRAYRHGTLDNVKTTFALVDAWPAPGVRQSLAFLALQERRPDVLKFFLDEGGFPFESYFEDEADKVDEKKDRETFNVLEHSRFRQLHPRDTPEEAARKWNSHEPWVVFDRGGRLPVDW